MHSKRKYTRGEVRMNKLLLLPSLLQMYMPVQQHISNNIYFKKYCELGLPEMLKGGFGNLTLKTFLL